MKQTNEIGRTKRGGVSDQKFKSALHRAWVMQHLAAEANDNNRVEYWTGYHRGLNRAYYGETFGSAVEHRLWLLLVNEKHDEARKQRGLGYRDGLAFEEASSRIGRPPISNEKTKPISVRLPLSVFSHIPEPHSQWLRDLIISTIAKKK